MVIKLKGIHKDFSKHLVNKIFIYPTDTIYGIGCDAENVKFVEEIKKIKGRENKPLSIIAPSFEYILKNCKVTKKELDKYLPGKYTLILKKKKKNFLNHVSNLDTIGIRIPKHKITQILQKTGKPIITTSVNFSGEKSANKISEINKNILEKVDFIIDNGALSGKPSRLVINGKIVKR